MSIHYPDRFARFLPAISKMYADVLWKGSALRSSPIPTEDLDFLNPTSTLFHLDAALYSAGQAAKTKQSAQKQSFVTARPSGCVLVGDSGGYQIQTGAIKWRGDETREQMLCWMEANCDWSMILDFPTGGIGAGTIAAHRKRIEKKEAPFDQLVLDGQAVTLEELHMQNGLGPDYNTCLYQTLYNNNWFVQHRTPGATKLLNVLQGRDERESKEWYQRVKHYSFEGWAIAGATRHQYDVVLRRIINMRDDGLLEDRDWCHFLGVGGLEHGCILTTIQECIRSFNPRFRVSFDVSSAFTGVAYGTVLMSSVLGPLRWTSQTAELDDLAYVGSQTTLNDALEAIWRQKEFINSGAGDGFTLVDEAFEGLGWPEPRRFLRSSIGDRITLGDICLPPVPEKPDKPTWDSLSYLLLMNHNVELQVRSIVAGLEAYEAGNPLHVPSRLLAAKQLVKEVFHSQAPDKLLRDYGEVLTAIG